MTEIEEAKARLRAARWADGSAVYVEADKDDLAALLAHVDRLEALSTPAPDPVERIVAWLKSEAKKSEEQYDGVSMLGAVAVAIERGDWKLPAPSAIPEAGEP
jgi:hypothetical protein